MKNVIVFLADGFEECEGLLVVDLLRRAGINVTTASVMGRAEITSSHRIRLLADVPAENADYASADMIVLPGGMPGTNHLYDSQIVCDMCRKFADEKSVAAICAAPSVLGRLGLLKGKKATCYPGFEEYLDGAEYTGEAVETDGNIITGQALGAAIPFALEIIAYLISESAACDIADKICY